MKAKINKVIIISSLIFTGCANNKYQHELDAVQQRINLLRQGDAKICNVIKQCRYIKDLRCYSRLSPGHIRKCEIGLINQAESSGGDTFVFQLSEDNRRFKSHTSYGQVYDCRDTSQNNGRLRPLDTRKSSVRLFHSDTLKECGTPTSCKPLANIRCTTRRPKLVIRCINDANAKTLKQQGNAFVIKGSRFYKKLRGYELTGQAYVCNN